MRNAMQFRCARQSKVDALGKAGRMREARQAGFARQDKADKRGKAGRIREVWQDDCSSQCRWMRE
jgi:hypothetical protein